jgi:hypothetical protein
MTTENVLYSTTSATHSDTSPNKLHDGSKLLHLRPALYILMQKAIIRGQFQNQTPIGWLKNTK